MLAADRVNTADTESHRPNASTGQAKDASAGPTPANLLPNRTTRTDRTVPNRRQTAL